MPRKIGTEKWRKKHRQEHLDPIYRDMVLIQIEPCGAKTMRVIGQAERYVKENQITEGQIWCVYDKDSLLHVEQSSDGIHTLSQ